MRIIAIIATLLICGATAGAADVDFSAVLTDPDGAPIIDCVSADCAGKPPLTLGRLALHVLTASFPDEQGLSGEEKFRRGLLAMRVYGGGKVVLNAEDTALIKRLIAKGYGPLVVLRAWPLLDPPSFER
jgi:hypothetical protein